MIGKLALKWRNRANFQNLSKLEIKIFKSLKNIDTNGQTCGPGFFRVRIKSRLFMVEVIIGGFFPQIGLDDVLPSFITSLFPPVQIIPSSLKLTCIRVDGANKAREKP